MHFSPIPWGFSGLLFDLENKIPGVSRGSTPGEANDKCIMKPWCFYCFISLSKNTILVKVKKRKESNESPEKILRFQRDQCDAPPNELRSLVDSRSRVSLYLLYEESEKMCIDRFHGTSLLPCWRTITKDSSLASVVSSSNMATTFSRD